MDHTLHKKYHVDRLDPKNILYTFISKTSEKILKEETCIYPMEKIYSELASGRIRGNTLIDFSMGPCIAHLFKACEFFKEITILEASEVCVKELEKWMNKEPDAFDWSHMAEYFGGLDVNSGQWQEKEENLRKTIKHILKCDFTKENPTDPVVLEKADCLISVWGMTAISKDHEGYCSNLKKLSSMLKLGGYLIMFGTLNTSYIKIGDHKFYILTVSEEFVRKACSEAGFKVERVEVTEGRACSDIVDYEHFLSVTARKVKEV